MIFCSKQKPLGFTEGPKPNQLAYLPPEIPGAMVRMVCIRPRIYASAIVIPGSGTNIRGNNHNRPRIRAVGIGVIRARRNYHIRRPRDHSSNAHSHHNLSRICPRSRHQSHRHCQTKYCESCPLFHVCQPPCSPSKNTGQTRKLWRCKGLDFVGIQARPPECQAAILNRRTAPT